MSMIFILWRYSSIYVVLNYVVFFFSILYEYWFGEELFTDKWEDFFPEKIDRAVGWIFCPIAVYWRYIVYMSVSKYIALDEVVRNTHSELRREIQVEDRTL